MKKKEFYQNHHTSDKSFNIYQEILIRKDIKSIVQKEIMSEDCDTSKIEYLDIGCGTGKRTKLFKNFLDNFYEHISVSGLDISSDNINEAEKRGINVICSDIEHEKLPIKADFITCFEVIEHIYDTDGFVRNVQDTLHQNGILLISTPNTVSLKNRIAMLLGVAPLNLEVSLKRYYGLKFFNGFFKDFEPSGHIRGFTPLSFKEILEKNGFNVKFLWGLENWRSLKFLGYFPTVATNVLILARRSK